MTWICNYCGEINPGLLIKSWCTHCKRDRSKITDLKKR